MGSDQFTVVGRNPDIAKAFSEVRDRAMDANGNQGYTGSIAEKHDYRVHFMGKPLGLSEAATLADELLEDESHFSFDKWGPAGALALCDLTEQKMVRELSIDVMLDAQITSDMHGVAIKQARAEATNLLAKDECIVGNQGVRTKAASRRTLHRPDGAWVTRYVVSNTDRAQWKSGFENLAEAVAYAENYEPAGHRAQYQQTYEVTGVIETSSGSALAYVERRPELLVSEVTFSIGKRPTSTETVGWLFFGYAAC